MNNSQNDKNILQQLIPVIGLTIGALIGLILGFLFDESALKARLGNRQGPADNRKQDADTE